MHVGVDSFVSTVTDPETEHLVGPEERIEHLRRLRLEPGWPILLNLLDSQVQKQEDALRRASKDDPFNRQNQAGWARIGALEEARRMLEQTIDAEVMQMGQGDEEDA